LIVNSVVANSVTVTNTIQANGSYGTSGQVLASGGSTGNVYWTTGGGGGGTPGGANTQLQFNNSGAFGGDANLVWNTTTGTLSIGNSTVVSTINSTVYNGTANNATNLGGLAASNYANTSNPIITTTLTVGNSTVNTVANSTTIVLGGAGAGSILSIGNSTVNTTINSTSFASTHAVNGYTYLTGGLLMVWGTMAATTTSTSFAWPKTFVSNAYNVQLTAIEPSGAYVSVSLQSFTNGAFFANVSAAANVCFTAIGV